MAAVIGYAGMTHLGLNSAVAAAARGFDVVCFDPDAARIAALDASELPVVEPQLPELFATHRQRLTFSAEAASMARCDVAYVAPDVPTNNDSRSDLSGLSALIKAVDSALSPDAVMVVLSQVPPGFTRSLQRPPATRFYQVETLIFGQAMDRAMNPERFIVGCADPAKPLPPVFAKFLAAFGCPVLPMRYESAELCKISINAFLVASVTTTNTLAELCERTGADWSEIVPALRLDKRIGPHAYLKPGLGIAGGNLERDLATLVRMGAAAGTDTRLIGAFQANSRYRKDWALRTLHHEVLTTQPDAKIAVLGLAYKQDTHSIKNSAAIDLIRALGPYHLRLFDPVVPITATPHPNVVGAADALDACAGADALVIMTPWSEFARLDPAAVAHQLAGKVVIDPFSVIDATSARAAGLRHLTLGRREQD
jgi:UDPglucose 6-dehydrogenase